MYCIIISFSLSLSVYRYRCMYTCVCMYIYIYILYTCIVVISIGEDHGLREGGGGDALEHRDHGGRRGGVELHEGAHIL